MTEIQYNKVKPFAEIIRIFIEQQTYIGGADSLFDIYRQEFNNGVQVNTSCRDCVGAVLVDVDRKIKEYERYL